MDCNLSKGLWDKLLAYIGGNFDRTTPKLSVARYATSIKRAIRILSNSMWLLHFFGHFRWKEITESSRIPKEA